MRAVGIESLQTKTLASIGPVTSKALVSSGLSPTVEAKEASLDSLVEALETHYDVGR